MTCFLVIAENYTNDSVG